MFSFSQTLKAAPLALALSLLPVWAALPPRSPEQLQESAEIVVEGRVTNLKKTTVQVKGGTDTQFTMDVSVNAVKKGDLKPHVIIPVVMRQTRTRTQGWAGPQGQNDIPAELQFVRMFLVRSGDHYQPLEPNGWEPNQKAVR